MRTRSQDQSQAKRKADKADSAAHPNMTKRLRTDGGRQVLQPIHIKEEDEERLYIKSEQASPNVLSRQDGYVATQDVPVNSRRTRTRENARNLPTPPSHGSASHQSPTPSLRPASRVIAQPCRRKHWAALAGRSSSQARADIGAVPSVDIGNRAREENELPAQEAAGAQSSAEMPVLDMMRQVGRRHAEDLIYMRGQIGRHYPLLSSKNDVDMTSSVSESEYSNLSDDGDAGSSSTKSSSGKEHHRGNDNSDETDSNSDDPDSDEDEDENTPLIQLRHSQRMNRVSPPVPVKEESDTTDSIDEDEDDNASSSMKDEPDEQESMSRSSISSFSSSCSTCSSSDDSEHDDSEDYDSNDGSDTHSNVAIYNDEENAHTRLNAVLRRATTQSPVVGEHAPADRLPHGDGMQLRSPARIIQSQAQHEVTDRDEDADVISNNNAHRQSSSPPRAYDWDEYRLRARYLEQFKGLTAAQLDEAGRDLDYRSRKLNSKRSAYEMALHERAFPRY